MSSLTLLLRTPRPPTWPRGRYHRSRRTSASFHGVDCIVGACHPRLRRAGRARGFRRHFGDRLGRDRGGDSRRSDRHGRRDARLGGRRGDPALARMATLSPRLVAAADRLDAAFVAARQIPRLTEADPAFDVACAYEVLAELHARRIARGWQPVGRKIGFTNTTIWERYGVDRPMWSHVWDRTVTYCAGRPRGALARRAHGAAHRAGDRVRHRGSAAARRRPARHPPRGGVDRARLRDRAQPVPGMEVRRRRLRRRLRPARTARRRHPRARDRREPRRTRRGAADVRGDAVARRHGDREGRWRQRAGEPCARARLPARRARDAAVGAAARGRRDRDHGHDHRCTTRQGWRNVVRDLRHAALRVLTATIR